MRLNSMDYVEFEGQPREWRVTGLTFSDVNLIVGQNASGKTRSLNAIANMALRIAGEEKAPFRDCAYRMRYRNQEVPVEYHVRFTNSEVSEESYVRDGCVLLRRGADGHGSMRYEQVQKDLAFEIPRTEIAVSRRDARQYPYLLPLQEWASHTYNYYFGTPLGKDSLALLLSDASDLARQFSFSLRDPDTIVGIFSAGEREFKEDFVKAVLDDMRQVHYDVKSISAAQQPNVAFTLAGPRGPVKLPAHPIGLLVQESGLRAPTGQDQLSQGMFRVLSLLIILNYAVRAAGPQCVLVDDIGEGLDFERSSSLIRLLLEKARRHGVQLIMSTNDRFVMNAVPLECWTVLLRSGAQVNVLNHKNSRQLFEDFKFTGLNNFDLLATDFLNDRASPGER